MSTDWNTLADEALLAGPGVPVDEHGDVAPVADLETAQAYARDLRRNQHELDHTLDLFNAEIDRLKARRDDLAQAPRRKVELLTGALTAWHATQLEEAKAAGVPERKWPKSVAMPQYGVTLKSTAGRLSTTPPAEDDEGYVELLQWVAEHVPAAVTEVPASKRVHLGNLKQAVQADEKSGRLVLQPDPEDPDTWEVVPGVTVERGDRTHTVVVDPADTSAWRLA